MKKTCGNCKYLAVDSGRDKGEWTTHWHICGKDKTTVDTSDQACCMWEVKPPP